ncbi:MAG: hypothetical protein QF732_10620, partial [Nitrospinaceae bacterium]|nr:hypothetical protein [Nitrospinaceae bacterium]
IPTDTTTPFPSDIGDGPGGSQRAETTTYRILRDTNLAKNSRHYILTDARYAVKEFISGKTELTQKPII